MARTFYSHSSGCRVNQAEKEQLDYELLRIGYRRSEADPDVYIINTCAVTGKAEREARQLVYHTRKKLPRAKIVVTGCAATKWIKEGVKVEGVDLAIDNVNKEYLVSLLDANLNTRIANPNPESANPINTGGKFLNSGRLLLKIQDGCQRFCTFCIVPYLRGQPKSIRIKDLEARIRNYGESVKEVILTAINTQAYGCDTGESFIDLVKTVIGKTSVPRISFGSVHPWSVDDDFFKLYKSSLTHERLVKFFHIPLQSGSDKILAYMKRGYARDEFIEKLQILQNIHPYTFIGTDVIVGFLEESDQDFEDTYNFLAGSPIVKFHVFRFSPREKTAAFFMKKRLAEPSPAQKIKRAKALIELSQNKYRKFLENHVGKTFPALFLERQIDGFGEVLLNNQIPAFIQTSRNLSGEIKQVKITGARENKLVGSIISA